MNALANDLQAGVEILWYQIVSVLGRGGFGITYLAKDNNLGQLVAIKEYLPHEFGTRSGDSTVQPISVAQSEVYNWGLERFMSEAQTLAKFKHPNIVRVLSVFKENNTGYIVMEYEQGEDLSTIYKRKWNLAQRELEDIYYPIISGLASVHEEGFIHRDIKPANIYIRSDGSPVLIDFGAARQAIGTKTKTLTSMLSIGYAPFEQYNDAQGKQGPWTDIYSLGASLHQGITGEKPMESTQRGMALLHDEPDPYKALSQSAIEGYSPAFLRAIDQALKLQVYDRPQNLEEFLGMLKGEIKLPDLPKILASAAETVLRPRTIVKPRNKKSAKDDDSEQYTKTELISPTEIDAPDSVDVEVGNQSPPEVVATEKKSSSTIKILFTIFVFSAVIAGVIFYPTSEKSPEEIHEQKVDLLFKRADKLIANGEYYNKAGNGALGTYQEIITLEPNSSTAKNGIKNVAQHFLLQAEQFIDKQDFTQAKASLNILSFINPEFPGLKNAQIRISEFLNSEKELKQIEIYLDQANKALQQGQTYEPEGESAAFYFQNVLMLDPNNVTASLGLFEIAETIIDDAQAELKRNDTQRAESLVSLAEAINPDKPAIQTIRKQIGKTNKINKVLTKADNAYARNRYTTPEKDNAYEHYTQVLTIAPSNLQAKARLKEIADYYVARIRKYTQAGNIASANSSLKILANYFPDNPNFANLKNAINKKQKQISDSKVVKKKPEPSINKQLLPEGVNQQQDDSQVVQDIVGLFINALKSRDMSGLSKVSQMTSQQENLYASIFKQYQSLNIKVAPNSFTLSKSSGLAGIKIEIIDLVDSKGNSVVTSANWTKIELKISKIGDSWTKATII